jgi:BirA family transcriptional regulator, biotin operon repressor / biotin---[acetyl-CoA-carboxylase] ligase
LEARSCKSTMDLAHRLAKQGKLQHGDLIWTKKQTKGRGKQARLWYSDDQSLTFSIFYNENNNIIANINNISIYLGQILKDILNNIFEVDILLEWPNDLILNGKKLGGILSESIFYGNKLKYLIVGIGLNINNQTFPKILQPFATSIYLATGRLYDLEQSLKVIHKQLILI